LGALLPRAIPMTEADTCRKFVVPRRRLNPQDFLAYKMSLPSRKTQLLLRDVRAQVATLKRLHAETATELDALLPAILDKAFKGEL
jgi:type I restriction enzyme, S subunit